MSRTLRFESMWLPEILLRIHFILNISLLCKGSFAPNVFQLFCLNFAIVAQFAQLILIKSPCLDKRKCGWEISDFDRVIPSC